MKSRGCLNYTPKGDQSGLELYLTPDRYHLKRNTLDCQPLFRNKEPLPGDRTLETGGIPSLKTQIRALFNCYLFEYTLKDTLK